jgi:outer membrane protein assembly factor BamB
MKLKLCCLSFLLPAACFATAQWPQFRGPDGTGVAEKEKPPIHFGPGSNELWKVSVPAGASSPCVWGSSIFLTAFNDGKLETICLNRKNGDVRWRQTAPSGKIEKYHLTEGSPASATPATDGKNIVSYFGSCGLFCYDFSGKERWRLNLPTAEQAGDFGSGTSPIIAGKRILLSRDQLKGAELLAVDIVNGKVVWRADRNELGTSFGSPAIWKNGRDEEVVLPGHLEMRAYGLKDGAERWRVQGMPTAVCTTPVVGNEWLYFAGWSPGKDTPMQTFEALAATEDKDKDGVITYEEASPFVQKFFSSYDANRDKRLTAEEWNNFREALMKGENSLIAIKPGGKGNITESHIAWKQTRGLPYVPSPLFYRGYIYLIQDGGMMSCFNAKTGEGVFQQERIGAGGSYYTSPVAANGRIYVASVNGIMSVVKAGDKPDVIGRAEFKERLVTTPALVDNKIYIRTADHLWAFGK